MMKRREMKVQHQEPDTIEEMAAAKTAVLYLLCAMPPFSQIIASRS